MKVLVSATPQRSHRLSLDVLYGGQNENTTSKKVLGRRHKTTKQLIVTQEDVVVKCSFGCFSPHGFGIWHDLVERELLHLHNGLKKSAFNETT